MKKFIYLCCMFMLNLNMMAQIDLNDKNWISIVNEQFNEGALHWQWDTDEFMNIGNYCWQSFIGSTIAPADEHEIYQFGNCQINTADSTMHLIAYYDSLSIHQSNSFSLPFWMRPENGGHGISLNPGLLYYSGAIQYNKKHYVQHEDERKFLYGYFEICCKLPTHQGAFPAFWLHSANQDISDPYYEEIDIFEYSWSLGDPSADWLPVLNPNPSYAGDPKVITTGIYHNLHGHGVDSYTDTYTRNYPRLTLNQEDVSGWHTYSCEWMPDHIYWYLDGQLINSYFNMAHIPSHPLYLKTNYAIDGYYAHNDTIWKGLANMTIAYINVYQLKWNCDINETISCQSDLDNFPYAVKKTISITSSLEEPVVSSSEQVTFRVTDSFEILGPFEVQQGGEFTVIRQDCP